MKIENLFERSDSSERKLPAARDLMYKARTKYPSYDSQQALTLYMADQMADQMTTDLSQNKLINAQKRENEKLTNVIKSLGQELDDFEQQSQETDREVERLKQLSGTLTTGGVETQRKAKVSADDLEKLQKDLELLKSKPGMSSERFEKLQAQIKQITDNPSMDNGDLKKVQGLVSTLEKQKEVGDDLYGKLENQLLITKKALDDKEGRFAKYIEKKKGEVSSIQSQSAEEMKHYADIVNGYKEKIEGFDQFMAGKTEEIANLVDYAKQLVKPNIVAGQAIDKAKASSKAAGPQGLAQQYDQSEKERSMTNIADTSVAESIITELIRPAKDYGVPEYNEWLARDLPVLVKIFKNKYYRELDNKNPTYGDQQIAYTCEEHAPYLWKIGQTEEPVITKKQMDIYLTAVKVDLFRQPVEQEQIDLFNESLESTYERMLDNVIGLSYIKKV